MTFTVEPQDIACCSGEPSARVFTPTIVEKSSPPPSGSGGDAAAFKSLGAGFGPSILDVLGDLLFTVLRSGEVRGVFAPPDTEFPLVPDEVVGRRVLDLLPGPAGALAIHYLERAFRYGVPQVFSCQHSFQSKTRIFEVRLTAMNSEQVLALVRDVTDRQTLENDMIENSHRVQMRVGQELHDSLGQHLTGISFLSRALEKKLAARALPEADEAAEVSKLVLEAISQTRHLARGLFPAELENRGLLPALQELAANIEESCHLACSLVCDGPAILVSPETAMHLFRLAQEAVNNAVKHGKSRRVVIRIASSDGRAVLSIEDDGVGIPAERPTGRGLGMRIMNYRAQKIGGTLDVRPGESGGTVVACSFRPESSAF